MKSAGQLQRIRGTAGFRCRRRRVETFFSTIMAEQKTSALLGSFASFLSCIPQAPGLSHCLLTPYPFWARCIAPARAKWLDTPLFGIEFLSHDAAGIVR